MSHRFHFDKKELLIIEKLLSSNLRNTAHKITDKEVQFFKDHPYELDRLTSTAATKKFFLIISSIIGFVLVAFAIIIRTTALGKVEWVLQGIVPDLLFECGVALWGASVTVYLLEIVVHRQEIMNRHYRNSIKKKIRELEQIKEDNPADTA